MASNNFGAGGGFWQTLGGKTPPGTTSRASSTSSGGSRTSAAAQQGKRLTAYGNAAKKAGVLSKDGKSWYGAPDPNAALEAWLNAHDTVSGGGGGGGYGGGGGGGGGGAAVVAMQNNARARYGEQQAQLGDLYGDYGRLIEGNPEATKKGYDTLIADSGKAGQAIAQLAAQRQQAANAERVAGLSKLGVQPEALAAAGSDMQTASTEGINELAQQNAGWQGLQGVLSQAQQSRDRLDIQGVKDAETLAQRQLTQNYEQFMRALDQQLAAAMSGGGGGSSGGGGGSSGGTVTNKYRDKFEDAIFKQLLGNAGYGSSSDDDAPKVSKPKTTTTTKYDSNGRVVGRTTSSTR